MAHQGEARRTDQCADGDGAPEAPAVDEAADERHGHGGDDHEHGHGKREGWSG